jgi:hypothetical protein
VTVSGSGGTVKVNDEQINANPATYSFVKQAWWMARLSCIPIENQELADKDSSYQMYLLYLVACCYSFIEKLMELSKYGHLGTADYDGETLEETARNFIKFFKNQPKMGGFPQLENLLKDAE